MKIFVYLGERIAVVYDIQAFICDDINDYQTLQRTKMNMNRESIM